MANGAGNGLIGNGVIGMDGKPIYRDIDIEFMIKRIRDGSAISADLNKKVVILRFGNSGQFPKIKVPFFKHNIDHGSFFNSMIENGVSLTRSQAVRLCDEIEIFICNIANKQKWGSPGVEME